MVRSNDTGQIALWMIDTNDNEESFFVRHCYFTGGNDPCRRLKTALKADIDADAWASLNSDVSRPFPKPETGKIAVKVINDYGDEFMKVFEISAPALPRPRRQVNPIPRTCVEPVARRLGCATRQRGWPGHDWVSAIPPDRRFGTRASQPLISCPRRAWR